MRANQQGLPKAGQTLVILALPREDVEDAQWTSWEHSRKLDSTTLQKQLLLP